MADPATIIAIVNGSIGLALKCASVAKDLNDLATNYKQVKLTLMSMVQCLDTIQLAWSRIEKWCRLYVLLDGGQLESLANDMDNENFLQRLERSLEVGSMIMEALEKELRPYREDMDNPGVRKRTKLVWNNKIMRAHEDRIAKQALAMNLLLQAVQLESLTDRTKLLQGSQAILPKSDESAYSIVPSRMSTSTCRSSESLETLDLEYRRLSFEDSLFTARVYKRNYQPKRIQSIQTSEPAMTLNNVEAPKGKMQGYVETQSTDGVEHHARTSSLPEPDGEATHAEACCRRYEFDEREINLLCTEEKLLTEYYIQTLRERRLTTDVVLIRPRLFY
ncbi:hypothetical protein MMC28_003153 [Mycoblastus sanguinarius]|nr:hypothetical protein [Mycoblastus sanguinarius]